MDDRYKFQIENQTWKLIQRHSTDDVVYCKWIQKKKEKQGLSICLFFFSLKARLVACGFTQNRGRGYHNAFPPPEKLTSAWIIFALATFNDPHLFQEDVVSAFLKQDLLKEMHMKQSPGGEVEDATGLVGKLLTALNSLKQSPKQCYAMINTFLTKKFLKDCKPRNSCLLTRRWSHKTFVIAEYADNLSTTCGDD